RSQTRRYRASKFVRRHRIGVGASGLVLLVCALAAVAVARSARLATLRLAEVLRLSDLTRLSDAVAEADLLWPATPDRLPALEHWLEGARKLVLNLAEHRASLEALRARALPYDVAMQRHDRETHPDSRRLEALRSRREASPGRRDGGPDVAGLDSEIA